MGRGLSELQRSILTLSLANRDLEDRHQGGNGGADVYREEVLCQHFGWSMDHRWCWCPFHQTRDGKPHRAKTGKNFSMVGIGERRYRAAQAALTRAMDRLERRGLAVRVCGAYALWAGVNLTTEGVEVARVLSVNTPEIVRKC